jgi:transcriptional regulator with XRE-family HTH domain
MSRNAVADGSRPGCAASIEGAVGQMLSKEAKLLFLFFSPANPLWKELIEQKPITQQQIAGESGVSQSTLGNWKRGGPISMAHVRKGLEALRMKIGKGALPPATKESAIKTIDDFLAACAAPGPDVRVYDVAKKILSMTKEQSQKIIDEIVYDNHTLYPSLCYETRSEAERDFQRFGGLYLLYFHRRELWLKSPLRVRYVLPLGARYLIRCKLNAPIIHRDERPRPYLEYDGFIRRQDDNVFWKFANRDITAPTDFFDFITNQGTVEQRSETVLIRNLPGAYLTTGQDALRSIEHGKVWLRGVLFEDLKREGDTKTDDEVVTDWMHNTSNVLSKTEAETAEEWDWVEEQWKRFHPDDRNGV